MVALFAGSVALIGYAFAGYPAAMALLARVRARPVRVDPSFKPDISLIVVAYNEADVIDGKLQNVAALDYPRERLEVIVITDGSDDETPDLARRHRGVKVLHRPERAGKLAAMNRAAGEAWGEVLVFSDANNSYTPGALREIAARFADPTVGLVTGRKQIDDGHGRPLDRAEGLYWRYESKLKEWESSVGSVTAVAGEILAFRREAFHSPPAGTMNDDFVQAMLAAAHGWRLVYAPAALSLERASATIDFEATRRSRLVTGRWQALALMLPALARRRPALAWQVISHKGLRPLIPWALAAAAVSNAALAGRRAWARVPAALQLAFYVAALIGWHNERSGRRSRVPYLAYYFCRMNAATVRGLRDFVSGSREAVWARVERG